MRRFVFLLPQTEVCLHADLSVPYLEFTTQRYGTVLDTTTMKRLFSRSSKCRLSLNDSNLLETDWRCVGKPLKSDDTQIDGLIRDKFPFRAWSKRGAMPSGRSQHPLEFVAAVFTVREDPRAWQSRLVEPPA